MKITPLPKEEMGTVHSARMMSESKTPAVDCNLYDMRLIKDASKLQPHRQPVEDHVLTAMFEVNGHKAYTLLDSGSNTDAISFEFAAAHHLEVFDLEEPMVLQLGVRHSRATITRGARISIACSAGTVRNHYVDIVNVSGYDMIIGTPFMKQYKVMLDMANNAFIMQGRRVECLPPVVDKPPKSQQKGKLRPLKASDTDPVLEAKLKSQS